MLLREYFTSPSNHSSENPSTQIAGRIDYATTVKSKCHPNQKYDKTDDEWSQTWARLTAVLLVHDGEYKRQ